MAAPKTTDETLRLLREIAANSKSQADRLDGLDEEVRILRVTWQSSAGLWDDARSAIHRVEVAVAGRQPQPRDEDPPPDHDPPPGALHRPSSQHRQISPHVSPVDETPPEGTRVPGHRDKLFVNLWIVKGPISVSALLAIVFSVVGALLVSLVVFVAVYGSGGREAAEFFRSWQESQQRAAERSAPSPAPAPAPRPTTDHAHPQ